MVSRPVDSSMRSRQTGQVGSSIREGVGGARGLVVREEAVGGWGVEGMGFVEGVKGSLVISGNDVEAEEVEGVRKAIDLTKTT